MTGPELPSDLHPDTPDVLGLRRRVLTAAGLTLLAFVVVGVLLSSTPAPDWLLLPAMLAVWLLVVRPIMRPVRQAVQLRRALAYQAFLDGREPRDG